MTVVWRRIIFDRVRGHRIQTASFSSLISNKIRNIGIFAHVDAGKTTTTECFLYNSGQISQRGTIKDGTTTMDFIDQERERGITIRSAVTTIGWKDQQINIIDTPGHVDFTAEVERSVTAIDGAVVVLDGVNGVEPQTETVWRQTQTCSVSKMIFINKLDRWGTTVDTSMLSLKILPSCNPILINFPVFINDDWFIVDLISMTVSNYRSEDSRYTVGVKITEARGSPCKVYPINDDFISKDIKKEAVDRRRNMLTKLADANEEFGLVWIESEDVDDLKSFSVDQIKSAIRQSTISLQIVPVVCGSALKNYATDVLLNNIVEYFPSPLECHPPIMSFFDMKPPKLRDIRLNVSADLIFDEESNVELDPSSGALMLAFKIIGDMKGRIFVFVRIYSGSIKLKMHLLNTSQKSDKPQMIKNIFRVKADRLEPVKEMHMGDVGVIAGLCDIESGDTLQQMNNNGQMAVIVPGGASALLKKASKNPVCFTSLMLKRRDPTGSERMNNLVKSVNVLCLEDPSWIYQYNKYTDQHLIWGQGSLHLQVLAERLRREFDFKDLIEKPVRVAYKEMLKPSRIKDQLKFDWQTSDATKRSDATIRSVDLSFSINKIESEDYENTVLFDEDPNLTAEYKEAIQSAIHDSLSFGPQGGYPVIGVEVHVHKVDLNNRSTINVARGGATRLLQQMLKDQTYLVEPLVSIEIIMKDQSSVGALSNDLINNRRAYITSLSATEETVQRTRLLAVAPLITVSDYSEKMRIISRGAATLSLTPTGYAPIPEDVSTEMFVDEWKDCIIDFNQD
eukprot:GHVL01003781.1.p1 GENE.GHVL01003781.1~~GHVL01003781.1.p1  ORF type:complete len:793 (-),score=170.17 GHVL01003781.1:728-3106(-)